MPESIRITIRLLIHSRVSRPQHSPLLSFCIRSTMFSIRRYMRRLGLSSFRKCSALFVEISWHECELLRTALMDSPGCSGGAGGPAVSGSPLPWFPTTSPFFFLSVLSELFFLKRPKLPPPPVSEDDIVACCANHNQVIFEEKRASRFLHMKCPSSNSSNFDSCFAQFQRRPEKHTRLLICGL